MAAIALYGQGEARRGTWAALTVPLVWVFITAGVWIADRMARLVGLRAWADSDRWQDNITALFGSLVVFLALWLWLRVWEGRSLSGIGMVPREWKRIGGGFGLGLVMMLAVVAAIIGLGGYEITGPGAWYDHLTPTWLFAAPLVVIGNFVQSATREALFRGWMTQAIAAQWSGFLAILINVISYAGMHAGDITRSPDAMLGAVNLALMAWLLSLVAMRDDTVWGATGLSAAWALTAGLGFGQSIDGHHLNVSPFLLVLSTPEGAPWWLTGGDTGPNGSLFMTVVTGALLLWYLRSAMPNRGKRGQSIDDASEVIDH